MRRIVTSLSAADRLRSASEFLESYKDREVLLVSSTRTAGDELLRNICIRTGSVFGVHRFTVPQLAIEAAQKTLTEEKKTLLAGVAVDALAARAVHSCREHGQLHWFGPVANTAGFFRALASTIAELRLNTIDPERLVDSGVAGRDLANLLSEYSANLEVSKLADLATIFSLATAATNNGEFALSRNPVLFLDIAPTSYLEQQFIDAIASQAADVMVTVHAQDEATVGTFSRILKVDPTVIDGQDTQSALGRLRLHVFRTETPPTGSLDESVSFISATDENRECVEIARSVLARAGSGVPFDHMTVLLRNPSLYQPLLEDAFRRAGIPAFYTRGTQRPNPAGRALLALLACASERLSATRFSEYLSLSQVPDIQQSSGEPLPTSTWVVPQGELFAALRPNEEQIKADDSSEGQKSSASSGTIRAPRQWERLLVDAAVIGGHGRWVRRLEGLRKELQKRIKEVRADDDAARQRFEQEIDRLQSLQKFALPIISFLDGLPASETWGEWLDRLEQLARMSLRRPEVVLSVLAELRPMAAMGPVGLDEVREALTDRLSFLRTDSSERRYGKVFVATIPEVSGLPFEMVFLPGLGEDIFPRKSFEDPLLLDEVRAAISPDLATRETRFSRERLLLHTAAATAISRLRISYPRMDLSQGRARGPSFYALDVLRAITGRIPELRELQRASAEASQSQIGWSAPRDAIKAIDDGEFDLAMISQALRDPGKFHGYGRYLMEVSPILARSLQARGSRWEWEWSEYDGLFINADDPAMAALDKNRFAERSYSATALQHFAACPYRFLLNSIHRLRPREERIALERLDPMTRGSLFHGFQFHLFSRLHSLNLLPMTELNYLTVYTVADEVLSEVAEAYREEIEPAIPRIWQAEIEELRWDIRGWIRQVAFSPGESAWKPIRFELAFGLPPDPERDPHSVTNPVNLPGGPSVRGAIDLIEENGGRIRVTDHKTGRASKPIEFIGAGEVLQPMLYAETAEVLLGKKADSSRLFYCTERGEYSIVEVPVNDDSRAALRKAFAIIDQSIWSGFLPAAPRKGACGYCDYRIVCGPHEEFRIRRKPKGTLSSLTELREIP